MATPRNRKPAQQPKQQSALSAAIDFVSVAQADQGAPFETHCIARDGWLKAFDGVITAGTKINEDMLAAPNTKMLKQALARCGDTFTIVQPKNDKLALRSGAFAAYVDCVADLAELPDVPPDAPLAPLSDALTRALGTVQGLVLEKSDRVATAAILLRSGSAVASDGFTVIEAWHGLDLPSVLLPKAAAVAILKAGKRPVAFGYSATSATFHFEDGSWIRSQLYVDQYPNMDAVLDVPCNPWPVPDRFFEALRAVQPFCDGNAVYFVDGVVRSHMQEGLGATFALAGIPNNVAYNIKYLLLMEPHFSKVDLVGNGRMGFFFNGDVRGAICQMSM